MGTRLASLQHKLRLFWEGPDLLEWSWFSELEAVL